MVRRRGRHHRCVVLAVAVVAAYVVAAPPALAASDPGASDAVANQVRARLGTPTELFVNCPTDNTITDINGASGLECEFRAVVANLVRVGTATAIASGGPGSQKISSSLDLPKTPGVGADGEHLAAEAFPPLARLGRFGFMVRPVGSWP